MALLLEHKQNQGVRITHIPSGRTIDVMVSEMGSSGRWAIFEINEENDVKKLKIRSGDHKQIAENFKMGVSSFVKSGKRVHALYDAPKEEYDIKKMDYFP